MVVVMIGVMVVDSVEGTVAGEADSVSVIVVAMVVGSVEVVVIVLVLVLVWYWFQMYYTISFCFILWCAQ